MDPDSVPPRSDVESSLDDDHSLVHGTNHLARFEFSKQGTKILMVEWQPDHPAAEGQHSSFRPGTGLENLRTSSSPDNVITKQQAGWEVSWPGKSTIVPARDNDGDGTKRRVYFLLPPEVPVPPTVTITREGSSSLILKPLPAIFPDGFALDAGTRGVLHTLWAKSRVSELEKEMDTEMRANAESVGLEMAGAERQWIIENFLNHAPTATASLPMSPRSPIGGRLGEKLKGLRLGTSPEDLIPVSAANTFTRGDGSSNSLLPQDDDIAISSFSAMTGDAPSHSSGEAAGGVAKVDAFSQPSEAEEGLFALPMSPRSPDMKRSPFSIIR